MVKHHLRNEELKGSSFLDIFWKDVSSDTLKIPNQQMDNLWTETLMVIAGELSQVYMEENCRYWGQGIEKGM